MFMTHPEHGAIIVSQSDVSTQEKNGWKVSTTEEWLGAKLAPVDSNVVPIVKGKPGRKPKVQ